ncbi:hypothetical protein PENSPDRAFT_732211 [Peniophora sp. CONT]|nr:hypothetical protein PENSPDRAFT_732211 [Peniophora sp. CONT]
MPVGSSYDKMLNLLRHDGMGLVGITLGTVVAMVISYIMTLRMRSVNAIWL